VKGRARGVLVWTKSQGKMENLARKRIKAQGGKRSGACEARTRYRLRVEMEPERHRQGYYLTRQFEEERKMRTAVAGDSSLSKKKDRVVECERFVVQAPSLTNPAKGRMKREGENEVKGGRKGKCRAPELAIQRKVRIKEAPVCTVKGDLWMADSFWVDANLN